MKLDGNGSSRSRTKARRQALRRVRRSRKRIERLRRVEAELLKRRLRARALQAWERGEAVYDSLVRRGREHGVSATERLVAAAARVGAGGEKAGVG